MTSEGLSPATGPKPYEVFGFSEVEQLNTRVSHERLLAILEDDQTLVHRLEDSSNNYGEFLFLTTSRFSGKNRVCMTFYGLGYHDYRERWLTDEWFWYQSEPTRELISKQIPKEEVQKLLKERLDAILPELNLSDQTERGRLYELIADLTDEDGAISEIEDLDAIGIWLIAEVRVEIQRKNELLDKESREKLPPLYSGEEKGANATAQVKFFTPDSNWTWYASEFNGEDIFFGLVNGFELEYGYFSLKELDEARGPLGLPIERDIYFEPKTLKELEDWHMEQRRKE